MYLWCNKDYECPQKKLPLAHRSLRVVLQPAVGAALLLPQALHKGSLLLPQALHKGSLLLPEALNKGSLMLLEAQLLGAGVPGVGVVAAVRNAMQSVSLIS